MVVVGIKDITSLLDAHGDVSSLLQVDELVDVVELGAHARGCVVLAEHGNEGLRVLDELDGVLDSAAEERVKLITTPFDAVLDKVGEVTKSAHGDGLLGRILRVTVALSLVRDDHLGIGLGAKSS